MKRLFALLPLLTPLACAGEANAGTLRSVILIAAGVILKVPPSTLTV